MAIIKYGKGKIVGEVLQKEAVHILEERQSKEESESKPKKKKKKEDEVENTSEEEPKENWGELKMNIRRIYILSDLKLSPKDCLNHGIFPKLIGFYKGKPLLEVDFVDSKENRNLIQFASSHEKSSKKEKFFGVTKIARMFGQGKGFHPKNLFFTTPNLPYGEVSPAVDVEFLKSFISAGVDKMKEYIDNEDFYSAFISAECIKKTINLISNFKETEQSKIVPTEGLGIYEFDLEEFERELNEEIPSDEFYVMEKQIENDEIKYSTIKPLSLDKIKSHFKKLASKYPYLLSIFEEFLSQHSSLFSTESADLTYFTKEGSILEEVEVKVGSKSNTVQVVYKLSKEAIGNEILRKINATILKEAYIRKTPGAKNSKGESAPWCIYSHKTGKKLSCHKTKSEAQKHLKRMEYFKHKKKGSFYILTLGNSPVFVSRSLDEALNEREKIYNIANLLAYTNLYLTKDASYENAKIIYQLIKKAEAFYKAADILPLTVKDDQIKEFVDFVDEIIETLDELEVSYKAAFTVINSNKDTTLSPKEKSEVNEVIDTSLQERGFVFSGGDGESVYSRSVSSYGKSKDVDVEEVKKKLSSILSRYNVTDPSKFPPTSFSIAIIVNTDPRIAISNNGIFVERKEEKEW